MTCPSAQIVHQYKLFYQWDGAGRVCCSRLNEILECDGGTKCLPPVVFGWSGADSLDQGSSTTYVNNTGHGKTQAKPNNFQCRFQWRRNYRRRGPDARYVRVLAARRQSHAVHRRELYRQHQPVVPGLAVHVDLPSTGNAMQVIFHNSFDPQYCNGTASFYNTLTTFMDYDGDGYSDVAVRSVQDATTAWVLHNGANGTFTEADDGQPGHTNGVIRSPSDLWADFNGDGRSDYIERIFPERQHHAFLQFRQRRERQRDISKARRSLTKW